MVAATTTPAAVAQLVVAVAASMETAVVAKEAPGATLPVRIGAGAVVPAAAAALKPEPGQVDSTLREDQPLQVEIGDEESKGRFIGNNGGFLGDRPRGRQLVTAKSSMPQLSSQDVEK
jgi:hypothetical protein